SIVPIDEFKGGVSQSFDRHPVELQLSGALFEGTRERDEYLCHLIMISQAGEAAQSEFCPDSLEEHHGFFDRQSVKKLMRERNRYATADERHEKIDELFDQTTRLVMQPWCSSAIHALARAL